MTKATSFLAVAAARARVLPGGIVLLMAMTTSGAACRSASPTAW